MHGSREEKREDYFKLLQLTNLRTRGQKMTQTERRTLCVDCSAPSIVCAVTGECSRSRPLDNG